MKLGLPFSHADVLACSVVFLIAFALLPASAATTVFFGASQSTNLVTSGATSDAISSERYLFTLTRDKLFTGGVGLTNPIGRQLRVRWPDGLEAQAVTSGPVMSAATITISRQDGQQFAIGSFTAKLLANTAGAGGSIEIMPMLNGEDTVRDPFAYNASGIAGNNFHFETPELKGGDKYKLSLYVDFALTSLTLVDNSIPPPSLDIYQIGANTFELSWPSTASGYRLEACQAPGSSPWVQASAPPVLSGDFFTVQVENSGTGSLFFRLKQ